MGLFQQRTFGLEIVDDRDRGNAALTFVIDTSGSMDRDDRLGLVKESLSILVDDTETSATLCESLAYAQGSSARSTS